MFSVHPSTRYDVCGYRQGVLLWTETFQNLVTTAGMNKLLDATFKTGLAGPAWYLGLVDNASWTAYAAADTMASHTGWIEGVPYSDGTRPALALGTIALGSVNNGAAQATYHINAALTIRGAFLVDVNTKSGATGTLYGVGDFSLARPVINGDLVTVKCTLTVS